MSTIMTRNGERRLLMRRADKRGWKVARWCDCIFGPHWHYLGECRTQADAFDVVRDEGDTTSREPRS